MSPSAGQQGQKKPKPVGSNPPGTASVQNFDHDEIHVIDDTDFPPNRLSASERAGINRIWKEFGEWQCNSFPWNDVLELLMPRMIVVYMETNLQEDHRAAKVVEVFGEGVDTEAIIRFRLFTDSMFEFSGATIRCSLAFVKPIEHYELHHARRFSYFGPPPRFVKHHGQTIASKLMDSGSRQASVVWPELNTGSMFKVRVGQESTQFVVSGMFLGAIRSYHCDNSEWKVLSVVIPDDQNYEDFVEDCQGLGKLVAGTLVSDFLKNFVYDPEGSLVLFSAESDVADCDLFRNCFKTIDSKLLLDPTWRPPSLSKVWKRLKICLFSVKGA